MSDASAAQLKVDSRPAAGGSLPIGDYRPARRLQLRGAGRPRRVDRLALPAALRQPGACSRGILDPDAGHWSIRPPATFDGERRYLPGTLVIETTFTTADGHRPAARRAWPSPRASAATTSATTRRTSCCAASRASRATVELELELAPRPEYGLVRPLFRARRRRRRARSAAPTGSRSAPACPLEVDGRRRCAPRSPCRAGEQVGFALRWAAAESAARPMPTAPDAGRRAHRRHRRGLALVGGRARHLRRARTASSSASARACSRA